MAKPIGSKKTGGRTKGTPNKSTSDLKDRIEQEFPGYDPVMAMAALANDNTADPFMRFQASKEVAQYVHAKRKALEIDATVQSDFEVILPNVPGSDPPED